LCFQNSAAVVLPLPLLASVVGPRSAVTVATSIAIGCLTISLILNSRGVEELT
jgi:hypothetical protein